MQARAARAVAVGAAGPEGCVPGSRPAGSPAVHMCLSMRQHGNPQGTLSHAAPSLSLGLATQPPMLMGSGKDPGQHLAP